MVNFIEEGSLIRAELGFSESIGYVGPRLILLFNEPVLCDKRLDEIFNHKWWAYPDRFFKGSYCLTHHANLIVLE
jgi:hypothetical protein